MALILGIDTSMSACSVALVDGAETVASASDHMTRGQSEALAPMIDKVMTASDHDYGDIDAIAVTRGPGAFTGLRIGLAAARSLALTIGCPCLGISTFDVLSRQAMSLPDHPMPENGVLVIAIETKRDDFYVQASGRDGSVVIPPSAMMADDIATAISDQGPVFICGDGTARLLGEPGAGAAAMQIIPDVVLPDPALLAICAGEFIDTPDSAPASPLYIRPPDVTMPKQG